MRKIFIAIVVLFSVQIVIAQETVILKSEYIPRNDSIHVYLPEDYDKSKDYPLVYLLHGYMGDYKQWGRIADLQMYANEFQFIIVCPDGFRKSWYINSPIKLNWQYESYFFEVLSPYIQIKYNVDKSNIFITGLSMGGHGALYLFTKKPEYFRSAGSMSGVMNLRIPSLKRLGVPELIGEYSSENLYWDYFSVINNIEKLKNHKKSFIFDCGLQDGLLSFNDDLYEKCKKLQINAIYTTPKGNHNHEYWEKAILAHFTFFYQLVN